jgi:hypothetical protein
MNSAIEFTNGFQPVAQGNGKAHDEFVSAELARERKGTRGRTFWTRCVAASTCLLAQQLGQKPLFLHENATIFSSLQQLHLSLRNPCARTPPRVLRGDLTTADILCSKAEI